MPQHDNVLSDQNGLAFLTDLNAYIAAAVSKNSGPTEPANTFPFMWWADTTTGILKIRSATDEAWVTVGDLATARFGAEPADANIVKKNVANNFTLPQRSALLTDNDGNFDLSAKQNFKCTTAAGLTLTFSNQADGLSGSVYFINSSNHAIAAHANTKITTSDLTKLSVTGTYRIDYMTDGTNALCSVVGPY